MATTVEQTSKPRYASFQLRLVASLLDLLVLLACLALSFTIAGLQLLITSDFGEVDPPSSSLYAFVFIIIAALFLFFPVSLFPLVPFYYGILWALGGQTIGMMAMGIKVVRPDGRAVGLRRASLRLLGYFLSTVTLFAGFLMAAVHPQKRALHDRLADTIVIEIYQQADVS